jgi:glycosyltransferase involved in cell wall biosynthesis
VPDPERRVLIWRSAMLAGSETFVRNHALRDWQPVYLGATRVDSPLAASSDVIAFPDTAAGRRAFLRLRLTGRSPRLRDLVARLRPQVVHAHFGGDGWLISGSVRVPLIVTLHGHDVTRQPSAPGLRGRRYRRNLRTVFDRASVLLAVSGPIRDQAIRHGADPAKVRVHHTGIPIPAYAPAPEPVWDVIFVGRFVDKKGVDDLLAALARLDHPRALFIGAGPLQEPMRAYAASLRVDATFLGAQDPASVARHLSTARLLAAPSRTAADGDSEGLPTAILEAAARGVPAVATRHSGIPEAVLDGVTGLLGPERDPDTVALNIKRLLADDPLRRRLGAAARAHTEAHFNLSTQSTQLENLYDTLAPSTR